jgi:hypothetical protein
MAQGKQITSTITETLQPLERCLKENCAPERFCQELAKMFHVHDTEVALLRLEADQLRFLCPEALRAAGSIPVSSAASVAAHTVSNKKAEFYNNFSKVKHASVFETVRLGRGDDNTPLEKPIQRLLSAPVLDHGGAVLGVIQICRKGFELGSCGPEFDHHDLATIERAALLAADARFMRAASAAAAK